MEQETQKAACKVCFVTSAFNEESNIHELYNRCRNAAKDLNGLGAEVGSNNFRLIVADNMSRDNSREIIRELGKVDSNIIGVFNKKNYGPDASFINAARVSLDVPSQFTIILCSDLQDPPEVCHEMIQMLSQDDQIDGVLCTKISLWEGFLMKTARRLYYRLLRYSSRLALVPNGYHGFGCYRQEVIRQAVEIWDTTDLNLRQCFANACTNPSLLHYEQERRTGGRSSYGKIGYAQEATRALLSGDASTSRLAFAIGVIGIAIALIAGILIILNTLGGSSQYSGGAPTIMCLLILSFSGQMLMNALLSRQIEGIRTSFKPTVRFSIVGCHQDFE